MASQYKRSKIRAITTRALSPSVFPPLCVVDRYNVILVAANSRKIKTQRKKAAEVVSDHYNTLIRLSLRTRWGGGTYKERERGDNDKKGTEHAICGLRLLCQCAHTTFLSIAPLRFFPEKRKKTVCFQSVFLHLRPLQQHSEIISASTEYTDIKKDGLGAEQHKPHRKTSKHYGAQRETTERPTTEKKKKASKHYKLAWLYKGHSGTKRNT